MIDNINCDLHQVAFTVPRINCLATFLFSCTGWPLNFTRILFKSAKKSDWKRKVRQQDMQIFSVQVSKMILKYEPQSYFERTSTRFEPSTLRSLPVCRKVTTTLLYFLDPYLKIRYSEFQGFRSLLWSRLFLSRFWPLLTRASFFEAARAVAKIGWSLKSNHHYQI